MRYVMSNEKRRWPLMMNR